MGERKIQKEKKLKSGIYYIKNNITNEYYVGQSKNIKNRLKEHQRTLKKKTHFNNLVQDAYDKNKGKNFSFRKIEECPIEKLDEREAYWINYYDSFNNGYNKTPDGKARFLYKSLPEEQKLRKCKLCQEPFKYKANRELYCNNHKYKCNNSECNNRHQYKIKLCLECKKKKEVEKEPSKCIECGIEIIKKSNSHVRCKECSSKIRKEKERKRVALFRIRKAIKEKI